MTFIKKTTSSDQNRLFRSARRIRSEERLVELYRQDVRHRNKSVFLLREFDCSNGVADLVLVKPNGAWKKHRQIASIHPRWLFALKELPYRKSFTVSEFATLTGVTYRRAQIAISEFCHAGFCETNIARNAWIKVRQPRQIAAKIIAYEAKLTDWQRALIQADRYRDFAHEAWVLMDAARVAPAIAKLDYFRSLNIGLVAISASRTKEIYFAPKSGLPRSEMRFWQANAIIAANTSVKYRP